MPSPTPKHLKKNESIVASGSATALYLYRNPTILGKPRLPPPNSAGISSASKNPCLTQRLANPPQKRRLRRRIPGPTGELSRAVCGYYPILLLKSRRDGRKIAPGKRSAARGNETQIQPIFGDQAPPNDCLSKGEARDSLSRNVMNSTVKMRPTTC